MVHQILLQTCEELVEKSIIAACIHGSRASNYYTSMSDYDILAILKDYPDGIRYYSTPFLNVHASILFVDEELFLLDVTEGSLGEFITGRILTPYISMKNKSYLKTNEILLKKRICLEELEELILEHGELSRGLTFKPEYLAVSRMKRRMKVYPPLIYNYSQLLSSDNKEVNLNIIMKGYLKALEILQKERIVKKNNGEYILAKSFIDRVLKKKSIKRVINVLAYSRRALRSYLAHGRAGRISSDLVAKELTSKFMRGLKHYSNHSIDPTEYLFIKTTNGNASLKDETSAIELLERLKPNETVQIKRLGGALNEVFLAEVGGEQLVVKKFSNWYIFKWFMLNIAALGSKLFSVSGKERLSNEYGALRLLEEKDLAVQRVIHVSLPKRILIKEYINGLTYLNIVKAYLDSHNQVSIPPENSFLKLGEMFATVHQSNIALGDTKPENFLLSNNGTVYVLDLEQAKIHGDLVWDIAELLYYTGHYAISFNKELEKIVNDFIRGYLHSHGDITVLRKAASLPYLKVFSFWTPLPILIFISNRLRTLKE